MGFFAFINLLALRVNLSVAIIEMVNSTYLRELEVVAANVPNNSLSGLSDEHDLGTSDDNSPHTDDDDVNVRIPIIVCRISPLLVQLGDLGKHGKLPAR